MTRPEQHPASNSEGRKRATVPGSTAPLHSTDRAEQGDGLAEVIAAHDWHWAIRDSRTGDGVRIACTAIGCDWWAERDPDDPSSDVWAAHTAHLAAAVRAHYAEQAAALARVAEEAIAAIGIGGHSHWREGGAGGTCRACDAATLIEQSRAEGAAEVVARVEGALDKSHRHGEHQTREAVRAALRGPR